MRAGRRERRPVAPLGAADVIVDGWFADGLFLLPSQATPAPPSPDVTSGPPSFPNLTVSQFRSAFSGMGFSCEEPLRAGAIWGTSCRQSSGSIVAFGPNDHSINVVMATVVESSTAGQTGQLFDRVVQVVCPPADASRIDAWANGHMEAGGQTDVDGFTVIITNLAGAVSMSIIRSP
jgi:hypothetical protein